MPTPSVPARGPIPLWLVGGLAAIVMAVLAGAYFLLARPTMAVLAKDLRPAEAAAIVAELDTAGATYELRDGGTTILAPVNEVDQLRLKIAAADLPIRGLDGFELFDNSDLGLTDFAQRIKYQRAIQGELARTIMKIEGVIDARVHISMPERSIFKGERVAGKAAVTLSVTPPFDEADGVEGVQELVAAAIPDLAPGEVVVLNARGHIISQRLPVTSGQPAQLAPGLNQPDPLLTAVLSALPDRAVKLDHVEAPPTPGADTAKATGTLRITTDSALTAEEQERTLQAIATSSGLDKAPTVSFVIAQPMAIAPVQPSSAPPAPVTVQPEMERDAQLSEYGLTQPTTFVLIGAGIVAFVFSGVLFFLLRRSRHSLTRDDQRRLADRLKLSLDARLEEPVDAN